MNTTISYNISHFQEVLINIKKYQNMEKELKKRQNEKTYYEKKYKELEKKMIEYCQTLVNEEYLEYGKEPYLCKVCQNLVEGDNMNFIQENDTSIYICKHCDLPNGIR